MGNSNLVVCLMGPTASGKTDLALQLVQEFPFEIISVDSAMVYRGMDIGAAKPSIEELKIAPHRLIDIRDPAEPYSAADFCHDAKREIAAIQAQGRIPLLVGGTMLYFKALQQGLSSLPAADEAVRQQILQEAEKVGWEALHEKLMQVDPESAKRIHPNDPQRLQRALEIYYITGKPMTAHFAKNNDEGNDEFYNLGLLPNDRKWLHERIALRFHQMLENGFLDEVKKLFARHDLHEALPALRAVGYRQAWAHLKGEITYQEMIEQGIAATRQLAKRQITWLRSWSALKRFACDEKHIAEKIKQSIKQKIK